jgi:hypothetical protein
VLAPGPGHSPKDRSLSVKLDPDAPEGFVIHSFANDDAIVCRDYVRAKAGLPPWKPNGRGASARKHNGHGTSPKKLPLGPIVATYDYCGEGGELLSQTVRYAEPEKTFRRRRPDGKGGWIWSTKGVREVPYRLKDALAALPQGSPIAIVEGEKDADALWHIGVPATTSACGAQNTSGWKSGELCVHFQGADVILVPDNDDVGYSFINDVGAALAGTAKRIRVLRLPGLKHEGDASDWLEVGGTVEQWHELVEQAPDWVPPAPSVDPVDEEAKAAAAAREKALIDELASVSQTEYDRRRRSAADEIGVRRSTLDSAREARRAELDAERPPLFGHWLVEPWPEEVDSDALVQSIMRRVRSHVVLTADQVLADALSAAQHVA